MTTERISAHVMLRLSIPTERFAGVDLTTKHEEDDEPYFRAEAHVAENLTDLLEFAEPVEAHDVDVFF